MHHKILDGEEIIASINQLTQLDWKSRSFKISLMSLEEVNLATKTTRIMLSDLESIVSTGILQVNTLVYVLHGGYIDSLSHKSVTYRGYQFIANENSPDPETRLVISPRPPFKILQKIQIELHQHKINLNKISKLQNQVSQNNIRNLLESNLALKDSDKDLSLSLEESKRKIGIESGVIKTSIKATETQAALEALKLYEALFDQCRALESKFNELTVQHEHQSNALEIELKKNTTLQNTTAHLNSTIASLLQNKKELEKIVSQSKVEVSEQKAKLLRYAPQNPSSLSIKREKLVTLIKNCKKPSAGLFSHHSEAAFSNLKKLSKRSEELLSIEQITNCINDPANLDIFNHPEMHSDASKLSATSTMIRELAIIFRQGLDSPRVNIM